MQSIEELIKRRKKADSAPEAVREKFKSTYNQINGDLNAQIIEKANQADKFAKAILMCIQQDRFNDMATEYEKFKEEFERQL